jgi:hypothetical protein
MSDNPQADDVEQRARAAYESEWPHTKWEDLAEWMRALWRAHVTTGLPPR